ncbi:MAG: hypothetical protein OXL96_04190 [Candidatus Poribacteria bacterium]|nr:hypothetical protein [Candidatus Poribacteria bacterium]
MKYRRTLTTSVLLCLFIVSAIFAVNVSQILSAIKAAQVIEAQLNTDIMSLAQDVLRIQNSILDMQSRKNEMVQTRDELWYIANEAYTEYCGAIASGNSESANYYWQIYSDATMAIQHWNNQIYWIDYEIFIYTEVYLKNKNEKLAAKRKELDDILAEIDRLNALLSGDQTPNCDDCTDASPNCPNASAH